MTMSDFSQAWDFACRYAQSKNVCAAVRDKRGVLAARTADPRINPNAVRFSDSSTLFRFWLEQDV